LRAWRDGSVLYFGACMPKAAKFAQLRAFMLSRVLAHFCVLIASFRAQASVLKFYKIYASPPFRTVCNDGSRASAPFI